MQTNEEYPVLSLGILSKEVCGKPATKEAVRAAMLRQNAWIDKRLSELGISLGGKKWDRKWITDEYVTGVRQGNQGGR